MKQKKIQAWAVIKENGKFRFCKTDWGIIPMYQFFRTKKEVKDMCFMPKDKIVKIKISYDI